jgi:hypothetical protein
MAVKSKMGIIIWARLFNWFSRVIQALNEELGTHSFVFKSDATCFYYKKSFKIRLMYVAPTGHQFLSLKITLFTK